MHSQHVAQHAQPGDTVEETPLHNTAGFSRLPDGDNTAGLDSWLPDLTFSHKRTVLELVLRSCKGHRSGPTGLGRFVRLSLQPTHACTVEGASGWTQLVESCCVFFGSLTTGWLSQLELFS